MNEPSETQQSLADDLMIGAEKIAEFLYGDVSKVRDVYRNPAGLPFFKHGNSIAALKSTIRSEIKKIERKARETLATNRGVP